METFFDMLVDHLDLKDTNLFINAVNIVGAKGLFNSSYELIKSAGKLLYHVAVLSMRVPLNSLAIRLVSLSKRWR